MHVVIEFNKSAFKHGVTKENIRWAINHHLYDGPMEGHDNKYIVIGFDANANLLEVMYNITAGNAINIFHAMPCRELFFPYINYSQEARPE